LLMNVTIIANGATARGGPGSGLRLRGLAGEVAGLSAAPAPDGRGAGAPRRLV